ncbi:MAG: acetyltransferase [Mariprofundaceae bacterium]|nr:acetyltransferase [Mariprofundaceae bacterium]
MSGLLIFGAGGHGKVVAETAEAIGSFEPVKFLDGEYARLNGSLRWPVRDPQGVEIGAQTRAVVAIGNAQRRMTLLEELKAAGCMLPVLVHPTAWLSPSTFCGEGTVIFAGAVIQTDARLGRGVIINTLAGVDHDCVLGDGVHICPGAHLAGNVTVGEGSWLGIGCAVKQGVRIGRNVTVGAGAVVLEDVDDGLTVVGCPARPIKATE